MSLYTAETRRLVKRRFTKVFVLGTIAVLIAIAVSVFFSNRKVGAAELAEAKAVAQSDYREAVKSFAAEKKDCEQAGRGGCADMVPPNAEDFQAEWYVPATFRFRTSFPAMATTLAALLAMAAFVIGASFVGAEWSSGGMMNLLLWRPQRMRVLGTKLAALLVGVTALTAVLSAAWTGVFLLIANLRGTTNGMTSGAWQSVMLMELRGLAVVVLAATLGFCLAALGRHTAMAMGVAIGTIIVFQFGLGAVLAMAEVKFYEAYLLPIWAEAWMNKTYTVYDSNGCEYSGVNGCQSPELVITWPMVGTGMAALFVLITVVTMWTFRKRDIT